MSYKQKRPNMHISYGGKSVQQHKKNLLNIDPIPKHASSDSPFHIIDTPKSTKKDKPKDLETIPYKKTDTPELDKMDSKPKPSDSKPKPSDSKPKPKPSDSKPKPSAPKGALGSDKRKAEYDAKGWKYDDTIKGYNRDGSKKEVKSVKPEKKKKTAGPKTIKAKEVLKTAKKDAKEGQAGRQDTRKAKSVTKRAKRVTKREEIRKGRQAAKDAGLKGKAKREAIRAAKKAAKKKQKA